MRNRDYYLALEYGIATQELSEAEGAKIGHTWTPIALLLGHFF